MPLCYFAKEEENRGFITVDNAFINVYMADSSAEQLKVYMYGLYLCSMPLSKDNSIDHMMDALSLTQETILKAFGYWAEKGLITIFSYDPLQIQYHSAKNRVAYKTYKKEKYADFNAQLEQYFPNKMVINPNQYTQYYDFIEDSNISPEVLLMIIKHCVDQKGSNVSVNYVLQVARSWINDGIRTIDAVENRIIQRENNTGFLRNIAVAIGKTSQVTEEDKDLFTKWTDNWGFEFDAIMAATKKSIKSMQKLDGILDDCFKNNAFSAIEIEAYLKNKKQLTENAIQIAKLLGAWYDNPAPIVENYISPWIQKGYSIDGLSIIANYCFRNSLKKLEQMDNIVCKLYGLGIISDKSINDYFDKLQTSDNNIREILEQTGSSRIVTINDRDLYRIWIEEWKFDLPTIKCVAQMCYGKTFGEVGKKLALLKENNIFGKESAALFFKTAKPSKSSKTFNENDRPYDKDVVESTLLTESDLDNIEV